VCVCVVAVIDITLFYLLLWFIQQGTADNCLKFLSDIQMAPNLTFQHAHQQKFFLLDVPRDSRQSQTLWRGPVVHRYYYCPGIEWGMGLPDPRHHPHHLCCHHFEVRKLFLLLLLLLLFMMTLQFGIFFSSHLGGGPGYSSTDSCTLNLLGTTLTLPPWLLLWLWPCLLLLLPSLEVSFNSSFCCCCFCFCCLSFLGLSSHMHLDLDDIDLDKTTSWSLILTTTDPTVVFCNFHDW